MKYASGGTVSRSIEDYLEYKAADREVKEGDINGNDNPQGYSYKGISGR